MTSILRDGVDFLCMNESINTTLSIVIFMIYKLKGYCDNKWAEQILSQLSVIHEYKHMIDLYVFCNFDFSVVRPCYMTAEDQLCSIFHVKCIAYTLKVYPWVSSVFQNNRIICCIRS